MTPLALYPSQAALQKSAAIGGFLLFLSFLFWNLGLGDDQSGALMFLLAGLFLIGQAAYRHLRPKPVFEADAEGFSVRGKRKRSWDEFRGVSIRSARVGIFPVAKMLAIKTGKTFLGGSIQINFNQFSAPAQEMAAQIEEYAMRAKMSSVAIEPYQQAAAPVQAAPVQTARVQAAQAISPSRQPAGPAMSLSARAQQAGMGPVQSQPTLSERIFGRRKVL